MIKKLLNAYRSDFVFICLLSCFWQYFASSNLLCLFSDSELRVVLVGEKKVGKSSVGNTILGKKEFDCRMSPSPVTLSSKKIEADVLGLRVSVVDTPGLYTTELTAEQVKGELLKAVELSSPGPHVFLFVLQLGRFTPQEQEGLKTLQKMLSADVSKHTMLLFTYGDGLGDTDMKQLIREDKNLQALLRSCSSVYHVFNNKEIGDTSQVQELLDKIVSISEGGHQYYQRQPCLGWCSYVRSLKLRPFFNTLQRYRIIFGGIFVFFLCYICRRKIHTGYYYLRCKCLRPEFLVRTPGVQQVFADSN